jgi:hypothetical protein
MLAVTQLLQTRLFTTGLEKPNSYRRPIVHTARRFQRTPEDMRSFVSGKGTNQLRSGVSSNYGFSGHESLMNGRTSLWPRPSIFVHVLVFIIPSSVS